jgi:hypothetical protein
MLPDRSSHRAAKPEVLTGAAADKAAAIEGIVFVSLA